VFVLVAEGLARFRRRAQLHFSRAVSRVIG
jgi:hypothetical protein